MFRLVSAQACGGADLVLPSDGAAAADSGGGAWCGVDGGCDDGSQESWMAGRCSSRGILAGDGLRVVAILGSGDARVVVVDSARQGVSSRTAQVGDFAPLLLQLCSWFEAEHGSGQLAAEHGVVPGGVRRR